MRYKYMQILKAQQLNKNHLLKFEKSKYAITQEDLKKQSYGVCLEPSVNTILQLIAEEEHLKKF